MGALLMTRERCRYPVHVSRWIRESTELERTPEDWNTSSVNWRALLASYTGSQGISGALRAFLDLREAGESCTKHRNSQSQCHRQDVDSLSIGL